MTSTLTHFGATVDEWEYITKAVGVADLLPVVSNPTARVADYSSLKVVGKVPSRYNAARLLVGIPKWTSYEATAEEVVNWAKEFDYGICVQTREVRALDIDVEDVETAHAIVAAIEDFLMIRLPRRGRADSSKCLLAFKCEGFLPKRSFKCVGGIVEFLGTGQQFIAAGTHPKGARYEWTPKEVEFPTLSAPLLEQLWASLVEQFAIEAPQVSAARPRNAVVLHETVNDPVMLKLDILTYGTEGQAFIKCPFTDGHSTTFEEGSPTATAYFPAGTRGYARGHFKCLHASCAARTDEDFLDALGIRAAMFDVVTAEDTNEAEYITAPKFYRDRAGKILATVVNLKTAFRSPIWLGVQIRRDAFTESVVLQSYGVDRKPRVFRDVDYTRLRELLELKGFVPVSKELVRDIVHDIADEFWYDSAIANLNDLQWDGVPRCATFFKDCFGCTNPDPYLIAVSLYFWTALAGRILKPGCKADMVPILIGAQGAGKSYGIEHIAMTREQFRLIDFHKLDDNLLRSMQGCTVLEIGEMRGLHTSAIEAIKAFVTRSEDAWVMKYQEFVKKIPRRSVFIGTGNDKNLLVDPTGHRRWLPMDVSVVDVPRIIAEREQLWAEARQIYLNDIAIGGHGVLWRDAQEIAPEVHSDYTIEDEWEEPVARFLFTAGEKGSAPAYRKEGVSSQEIAAMALGRHLIEFKRFETIRLSSLLRTLKFERMQIREDEVRTYRWIYRGER